jgi:hypothetical protein
MKGQDKVIVPLKYKVQTTVNQVVPDSVLTRQSRKMHEPHTVNQVVPDSVLTRQSRKMHEPHGEEDERRAGR